MDANGFVIGRIFFAIIMINTVEVRMQPSEMGIHFGISMQ